MITRLAAALLLVAASAAANPPAVTPTKPIPLFDGRDFSAFDIWLGRLGLGNRDNVFSIVTEGGARVLRISGEHWGGLVTKENFTNYRLAFDYRWGTATFGQRAAAARNSGVLLHCQGAFGNYDDDFTSPWMRSVEFEMIEGGTGDFILVRGYDGKGGPRLMPQLTATVAPGGIVWHPQGTAHRFPSATLKPSNRIWWRDRDPAWKDKLGFRGAKDVERPLGEWNRVEIECRGGDVTFFLNGQLVNRGTDGDYTAGKLLFQSEGAEIFLRQIVLHPLRPPSPSNSTALPE